jgi:hypothetical protein
MVSLGLLRALQVGSWELSLLVSNSLLDYRLGVDSRSVQWHGDGESSASVFQWLLALLPLMIDTTS